MKDTIHVEYDKLEEMFAQKEAVPVVRTLSPEEHNRRQSAHQQEVGDA